MQAYFNQLLADIESITANRLSAKQFEADDSFERHIFEVERYLHEDPDTTLAQHTGLEKIRFPPAEKLSEAQCGVLTQALNDCYGAFGVDLAIPQQIPIVIRYEHFVAALDERVFTSHYGTTTIERCSYDYDGYCPFTMPNCPCHQNWEEEMSRIRLRPSTEIDEYDRLQLFWQDFRGELLTCNAKLLLDDQIDPSILDLVLRLQIAWERQHPWDLGVSYRPDPGEIPAGPGQKLFAWLEVEDVTLPERSRLSRTETRIIAAYLLQLLGKEYITQEVAAWPLARRYDALREHFSCLLVRAPTTEGMRLVCLPGQENIYEKREKSKNSRSDLAME